MRAVVNSRVVWGVALLLIGGVLGGLGAFANLSSSAKAEGRSLSADQLSADQLLDSQTNFAGVREMAVIEDHECSTLTRIKELDVARTVMAPYDEKPVLIGAKLVFMSGLCAKDRNENLGLALSPFLAVHLIQCFWNATDGELTCTGEEIPHPNNNG